MLTLRLVYTKENYMKFLSHLELMKLFERIFRFHQLPLKYSEGFNPIPKMTFAAPLSVGYSSLREVMEVQLSEQLPLERVLAIQFPSGIKIIDASYVNTKKSLMAHLSHAEYLIKVDMKKNIEQLPLKEWIEKFLNAETVTIEKKGKNGKMRSLEILPLINRYEIVYQGETETIFRAVLQSGSQGSLNPEALIEAFFGFYQMAHEIQTIQVERRLLLYTDSDGQLKDIFTLKDDV